MSKPSVRRRRGSLNRRRNAATSTIPPASDYELEMITRTCPGYNLGKAYKAVSRTFEQEFRSSNLTSAQFALLVNIGRHEPATGSEVAARLGSDLSTVSRTIALVVERGLVCEQRGSDRRVRMYRLTDEGRDALREAIPKWRRATEKALSEMSGAGWRRTLRQLRSLSMQAEQ